MEFPNLKWKSQFWNGKFQGNFESNMELSLLLMEFSFFKMEYEQDGSYDFDIGQILGI